MVVGEGGTIANVYMCVCETGASTNLVLSLVCVVCHRRRGARAKRILLHAMYADMARTVFSLSSRDGRALE